MNFDEPFVLPFKKCFAFLGIYFSKDSLWGVCSNTRGWEGGEKDTHTPQKKEGGEGGGGWERIKQQEKEAIRVQYFEYQLEEGKQEMLQHKKG